MAQEYNKDTINWVSISPEAFEAALDRNIKDMNLWWPDPVKKCVYLAKLVEAAIPAMEELDRRASALGECSSGSTEWLITARAALDTSSPWGRVISANDEEV